MVHKKGENKDSCPQKKTENKMVETKTTFVKNTVVYRINEKRRPL